MDQRQDDQEDQGKERIKLQQNDQQLENKQNEGSYEEDIQILNIFISTIDDSEKTEEVLDWLRVACAKDQAEKIIFRLIHCFQDAKSDIQLKNKIMRTLCKLENWISEVVSSQIFNDYHFQVALINFYRKIEVKHYIPEGLSLLQRFFENRELRKKLIEDKQINLIKFVEQLLDYLDKVDQEEIFELVVLLICEFKTQKEIMKSCCQHKNSRLFVEYLLQYLNRAEQNYEKALEFIQNGLRIEKGFMYQNDLRMLQELCMRMVNDGNEIQQQKYIDCLRVIVKYQEDKNELLKERILNTCRALAQQKPSEYVIKKAQEIETLLNK